MLIVDRITEGYAICEDENRTMLEIPLEQLPAGVAAGDCLCRQDDGTYRIDREQADRRRARNAALFQSLLADDEEDDDPPDVDDIREDYGRWEDA